VKADQVAKLLGVRQYRPVHHVDSVLASGAVRCPLMRRLARRLFTLCSAVSLLIFVGLMVLWIRSYFVTDRIATCSSREEKDGWSYVTYTAVESGKGGVGFVRMMQGAPGEAFLEKQQERMRAGLPFHQRHEPTYPNLRVQDAAAPRWGFKFGRIRRKHDVDGYEAVVPIACLLVVFAIAPAFWLWRQRRTCDAIGLCATCGYDLRASPERCPECGTTMKVLT
jgi:hypothetical protein